MRLHLNKTLRAALIAAITAVGTTLPQTFAETATGAFQFTRDTSGHAVASVSDQLTELTIPWSDSQSGSFTAGTMADGTAVTGTWSNGKPGNWQGGAWSNDAALADLNSAAGISLTSTQVSALQSIGAWGGSGNTNITLTLKDGAVGQQGTFYMFTSSCDFTPTGFGVTGLSNTTITCASATGDGWDNVVTAGAKNLVLYKVTGTINAEQVTFTNSIGKNGWSAGAYTYNIGASTTATWQGTFESHDWADSVWDIGTFPEGGKAVFGAEGYNEVTVSAATSAASVSVSDQEYTFEIESGHSLTAAKANIAASGGLTITGEGSATIISLSGAGDLTVGENGTATVNELSAYTGKLGVADGGTLNLASSITVSSLTVEDGTVTTQHNAASGVVANTLTIGEGGTFKVIGGHDAFGYNNSATKQIDMTGAQANHATLALEQNTGNSVTMTTNIAMHGYSDITVKEGTKGFNTYGCDITVDGVENTIDIIDLRNAVTIDVAEEGELSVGKFTVNGTSTAAVTKTGEGIMTITEASTLPGALNINGGTVSIGADTTIAGLNIAAEGTLTVTGGTTTVSGSTNVVSNTIGIGATGILNLTGTYDVSGIEATGVETKYVGGEGIADGNGFKQVSGKVQVLAITEGGQFSQEGATINYGGTAYELDTNGAFELAGTPDYTTFYVNGGEETYSAAQAVAQGASSSVSTVVLSNDTTINMDSAGASIGLVLAEGTGHATVNATAATTISSISGWENNKLFITGEGSVALPNQTLVLSGSTALDIDANVTAQKVQLNGDEADLRVNSYGSLTTSNNLTLTNGKALVDGGVVNIGHELDLSDGGNATGELRIASHGSVTAKDGMWMATTAAGVLLEEDATFAITGKGVKFTGKEEGGSITADNAEINYSANNANAVVSNVIMEATANITIGNTLVNVDVVTGEHNVVLNKNADSVTVSDGGSFFKGANVEVANGITVEDGGTISGGVDATDVKIESWGTATFLQGINEEGVQLGWFESAAVTNMKGEAAAYEGIHDTNMQVSTDVLMAESDSDVTVNNKLVVTEIMNGGLGTITVTNVDTQELQNVAAYSGDVTLQNVGVNPIELPNLSLYGTTAAVYTGDVATTDQEATVTITDVLEVEGGGTLLANLEMADGTSLLLNGAGDNALVLGSTLNLGTDIKLDAITLQALDAMSLGETLMLVKAADGTDFDYLGEAEWFGQVFSRSASEGGYDLIGDYSVLADADGFGLVKVSSTPEPTTGTLSLLALAALAARRRRK